MTWSFHFQAIDRWYFSDGRPFNQDDEGLSQTVSVFPPLPHILVGALRNEIARLLGWNGRDDWRHVTVGENGTPLKEVAGSGAWDTGALRFSNYRIVLGGASSLQGDAYPAPLCLGRMSSGSFFHWFSGPDPNSASWIGTGQRFRAAGQLALKPERKLQTSHDALIEVPDGRSQINAVAAFLPGEDPDAPGYTQDTRVGIALAPNEKATIQGMLFAATYVWPDSDFRLAIDLDVEGTHRELVEQSLAGQSTFSVPFGGRGRAALVRACSGSGSAGLSSSGAKFLVWLTSPALLDEMHSLPEPGETWPGRDQIKVVAAASDRIRRFGAWDHSARGPWLWALPAGACYLVQCDDENARRDFLDALNSRGLNGVETVGGPDAEAARRSGFGEVRVLEWKD